MTGEGYLLPGPTDLVGQLIVARGHSRIEYGSAAGTLFSRKEFNYFKEE